MFARMIRICFVVLLGILIGFSPADIKAKAVKGKVTGQKRPTPMALSIEETERGFQESPGFNSIEDFLSPGQVGASNLEYATAYFGRSIAVGSDGVIHVAWCTEGDPSNEALYSRSADNGESWTTPVEVHDGYYGYKPSVAVDPNDPTSIWVAYVGYQIQNETRSIRLSHSTDGGDSWGASIPVYGSHLNANNPAIAIDSQGNPHVAFDSYSDEHIRYNYSSDGGVNWFAEPEITTIGLGRASFGPTIAIDNNDNPHITFGGGGGEGSWNEKDCYWTYRDMTLGFWTQIPPVLLSAGDEGGTCATSLVFDSQGTGHLFYDGTGTTQTRSMFYRTYDGASWSDPPIMELPSVEDGGCTFWPEAGIDADDNLYLMYADNLGTGDISGDAGGWDLFTGSNITGDWEFVNLTADGIDIVQRYPNAAAWVVDTHFHILYTGIGDPWAIIHEVGYPWPPEPACAVNQLSDTYDLTGPFGVTAFTSDIEGYVVACSLFVYINGELEDFYEMTEVIAGEEYEYDFTVEGALGDSVTYIGRATDDEGYQRDSERFFRILEPSQPGADILLVDDNIYVASTAGEADVREFIKDVLDSLNYVYEPWKVKDHKGIDESVTNFGWSTIIIAGWGTTQVPTREYTDNPVAAFLSSGTTAEPSNVFFTDQDYFFTNRELETPTFSAGDMAYDFFGLAGGVNDDTLANRVDTLVIGEAGDPVSGDWVDIPIELQFELLIGIEEHNWIDWTVAGTGEDIFYTYETDNGAGVKYDAGNFKTVFLPWMYEAVGTLDADSNYIPHDDAYALMENVLEWFGTDTGYAVSVGESFVEMPFGFALFQNYPNPFNPVTHIAYDLPGDSRVELSIYNLLGQKVRTLVNRDMSGGHHVAVWDGKNEFGSPVSTGIYFYRIRAADFKESRKMILLK